MKMTKYGNNVLPYSLHSTVNLPAGKPKNTNVTSMSFLRLFTETITPERKSICSKLHDIDEIREELSTSHFVT